MLANQLVPHAANLRPGLVDADAGELDIVMHQAKKRAIHHVLNVAYGVGGVSTGVVFSKPDLDEEGLDLF
jgi:3-oxoacyl-(acyl-carrier-protein) synthase